MQAYDTTFEQIERLRELMLSFLKAERRDFQPVFDVYVIGAHSADLCLGARSSAPFPLPQTSPSRVR